MFQFGIGILSHWVAQEALWGGLSSRGVSVLAWMAEVWMVSPLSAALWKSAKQQIPEGFGASPPSKDAVVWLWVCFANEGPESTQKSESPGLGRVWSCGNAAGSLKHPFYLCLEELCCPARLWSSCPTHLQRTSGLSPPASVRAPKNHCFIHCFLTKGWWNHTYWQFHRNGAYKWIITIFIPMVKLWAVKKTFFMLSLV